MRTFRQPAKLTTRQRRQINAGRNGKRSIKVSGTTGSAREAPALLLLPNDDDNQPKAGSTGAKEKLSDDAKSLFNGKLVREMTDEDVEDNIRNDRFNIRQLREAASKRGLLVLGTKASLRDNLLLHFNGGAAKVGFKAEDRSAFVKQQPNIHDHHNVPFFEANDGSNLYNVLQTSNTNPRLMQVHSRSGAVDFEPNAMDPVAAICGFQDNGTHSRASVMRSYLVERCGFRQDERCRVGVNQHDEIHFTSKRQIFYHKGLIGLKGDFSSLYLTGEKFKKAA